MATSPGPDGVMAACHRPHDDTSLFSGPEVGIALSPCPEVPVAVGPGPQGVMAVY